MNVHRFNRAQLSCLVSGDAGEELCVGNILLQGSVESMAGSPYVDDDRSFPVGNAGCKYVAILLSALVEDVSRRGAEVAWGILARGVKIAESGSYLRIE